MSYNYSFITDFSSNFNHTQFHNEVANGGLGPTLLRVDRNGDTITVVFDASLNTGEETTLDGLVSAHTPQQTQGIHIQNIIVPDSIITNTTYINICTFIVDGTIWDITNICAISFMEEEGTSYDIKLFDTTNNNIIVTKTLTNITEENNDLGTLSNLPTNIAIIEAQVKVTGATNAHIKNINIMYNI